MADGDSRHRSVEERRRGHGRADGLVGFDNEIAVGMGGGHHAGLAAQVGDGGLHINVAVEGR